MKTEAKEIPTGDAENSQMQALHGRKNKAVLQVVTGVALQTIEVQKL